MESSKRQKLLSMAKKLAETDLEVNGSYRNAPYTVGGIFKARIRHSGHGEGERLVLELYQPEHLLEVTELPLTSVIAECTDPAP